MNLRPISDLFMQPSAHHSAKLTALIRCRRRICDFYRHRISSALPDRLDRLPNPRTGPPVQPTELESPSCRMTRNPIPLSIRSYRAFLATNNLRLLLSPLFEHSTPPLVLSSQLPCGLGLLKTCFNRAG